VKTERMPIVVLDELGRLLSEDHRGRLVAELAGNRNASVAVIRDRLPLYGVSPSVIEEIVTESENSRRK
jgi:hypothetical protein